jgi:hypothetical protein
VVALTTKSVSRAAPRPSVPHSGRPVLAKLLVTTAVDAPAFPLNPSSLVTSITLSMQGKLNQYTLVL